MTARSTDGKHNTKHDGEKWIRSRTKKPMPGHRPNQVRLTIDGKRFWADKEMVPLLKALNKAGLKTRSHCAGHGPKQPYSNVVIELDSILNVDVWRGKKPRNALHLVWKRANCLSKK